MGTIRNYDANSVQRKSQVPMRACVRACVYRAFRDQTTSVLFFPSPVANYAQYIASAIRQYRDSFFYIAFYRFFSLHKRKKKKANGGNTDDYK
jgi:hypothetical protein